VDLEKKTVNKKKENGINKGKTLFIRRNKKVVFCEILKKIKSLWNNGT